MKLSIKLNNQYRSFKPEFTAELNGELVVLSGINGGGKSQLINVINQQDKQSKEDISAEILLDGNKIQNIDIAYRSFKDNITVPEFGEATPAVNTRSRDQIWNNYSSHLLNASHQAVRDYKKSCSEAKTILIEAFGKEKFENKKITQTEIINCSLLSEFIWKSDDIFTNIVSDLFFHYAINELHARAEAGSTPEIYDPSSLKISPWKQLNDLFNELGFEYRFKDYYSIEKSSLQLNEQPILYQITETGGIDISEPRPLKDLSDGEKALISFAFSSLAATDLSEKKILLLDEFDANLNPSLTKIFFELLERFFISKGVMVVIATHSSVTISLAPENSSFYEVFSGRKLKERILPVQRDSYQELQIANERFYTKITDQEGRISDLQNENGRLATSIAEERSQIYFEGTTDIDYVKKAAECLGKSSIFDTADMRDGGGQNPMKTHHKSIKAALGKVPVLAKHLYIFDCDTDVQEADDSEVLFKRHISPVSVNPVKKGIENLLTKTTLEKARSHNGAFVLVRNIREQLAESVNESEEWEIPDGQKRNLCDWLISNGTNEDFNGFTEVLDKIAKLLNVAEMSK
jgi:ABC-type lipoprotein export system ATPase subunit